tara:strand:- start:6 stop:767 length:762 start_codon:yes stop_codon:yes gene_type:complete
MAKTYLSMTNELLVEINEPELTSVTSALGIQKFVSNCVNRAYFDIIDAQDTWSWLSTSATQGNYNGNTFVETVAGQRWYLLKQGSSGVDTDFSNVDWDGFVLTEEDVNGKTEPYTIRNLPFVSLETWRDFYSVSENRDSSQANSNFGVPERIIRSEDNRHFGLSPVPDEVYRIYFYAYDRPSSLVNDTDKVLFPEQYKTVLMARARYYIYQFKDNIAQTQLALTEYNKSLDNMIEQLNAPQPNYVEDDRRIFT